MGLLRKLFGPSREEVWRQLSEQMGAEFIDGGFWTGDKVVAKVGEWTVTLDSHTVHDDDYASTTYTRLRAPYVNADGLRFTLYEASVFTPIAEALGFTDIEVGDEQFDHDYVVKGNDPEKIRLLLAIPELRRQIKAQPHLRLTVKDDEGWFGAHFPEGVDELYFEVTRDIRDLDRLTGMFDLFTATLNRLCLIGSAYEDDPGVQL